MLAGWVVVSAALFYIVLLFLVATYGDRASRNRSAPNAGFVKRYSARPTLYALSLAVYCTSWTFFGSVGLAARTGWDFIGIYTGPILVFTVGYPLVRHIVAVSKAQRITSVADFISARYGKSQTVAMVATLIAVVGSVPYIALQLKAVSRPLRPRCCNPRAAVQRICRCPSLEILRCWWQWPWRCSRFCSEPGTPTRPSIRKV